MRPRRPGWTDLGLALVGTVISVTDGAPGPWAARGPTVLLTGAAVATARTAPLRAAVLAFVAVVGSAALGAYDEDTGWVMLVYVALAATAGAAGWHLWLVAGLSIAGPELAEVLTGGLRDADVLFTLVDFGAAVVMGLLLNQERRRAGALELRTLELALEKEVAVGAERRRLARELHDIVSHGVAVMVVQASVAELVLAQDPRRALAPLQAVQASGREAMGELQRLLAVLTATDEEVHERAPAPLVQDVPRLVERFRDAGIPVQLRLGELPAGLPPSLQLSVYRIVQESLTNTLRHAPGASVCVQVSATHQALVVGVTDSGPAAERTARPHAGGRGLAGLRERVAVYGGGLRAGPDPGGGFTVEATLPLGSP